MMELKASEYKRFEDIKHVRDDGTEYWSARELAPVLEYAQWRNFSKVIGRAMIACENSGHSVLDDFAVVSKIVDGAMACSRSYCFSAVYGTVDRVCDCRKRIET